jgi:hypothetical protein
MVKISNKDVKNVLKANLLVASGSVYYFFDREHNMKFYLHFEEAPSFTYIIKNASDSLTIAQVKSVSRCSDVIFFGCLKQTNKILIMAILAICGCVQCQTWLPEDINGKCYSASERQVNYFN